MQIFIDGKNSGLVTQDDIDQATSGALRNIAPHSGYWTDTQNIKLNSSNVKDTLSIATHWFWHNNKAPLLLIGNNNGEGSSKLTVDFPVFDITSSQTFSLNIAGFEDINNNLNSIKFIGRNDGTGEYDQQINIVDQFSFSAQRMDFKHFVFTIPSNISNGYIRLETGSNQSKKIVYLMLAYFTVIQGNVSTHEWTPAIEEMATKSDLATLKADIQALKSKMGGEKAN